MAEEKAASAQLKSCPSTIGELCKLTSATQWLLIALLFFAVLALQAIDHGIQ